MSVSLTANNTILLTKSLWIGQFLADRLAIINWLFFFNFLHFYSRIKFIVARVLLFLLETFFLSSMTIIMDCHRANTFGISVNISTTALNYYFWSNSLNLFLLLLMFHYYYYDYYPHDGCFSKTTIYYYLSICVSAVTVAHRLWLSW